MGHKILVDGTAYEITGGRTLIDGTGYDIKKGRTLIDGTGYDILFAPPPLIVYDGGDALVNGAFLDHYRGTITNGAITLNARLGQTKCTRIGGIDFTVYSTLNFIAHKDSTSSTAAVGLASETAAAATFIKSENIKSTEATQYSIDISDFNPGDISGGAAACISLYFNEGGKTSRYLYCTKIWLE